MRSCSPGCQSGSNFLCLRGSRSLASHFGPGFIYCGLGLPGEAPSIRCNRGKTPCGTASTRFTMTSRNSSRGLILSSSRWLTRGRGMRLGHQLASQQTHRMEPPAPAPPPAAYKRSSSMNTVGPSGSELIRSTWGSSVVRVIVPSASGNSHSIVEPSSARRSRYMLLW